MKRIKTKSGHIAYQASANETMLIGGVGVCDECNHYAPRGFLVPVLHYYMCPKCFADWQKRARHYPEDNVFESRTAKYYEAKIGLEA